MELSFCDTCGAKRVRDVKQELSKLFANSTKYQPDMCAICLGSVSGIKVEGKPSKKWDASQVAVKEECVTDDEGGLSQDTDGPASPEGTTADKKDGSMDDSSGSDTDSDYNVVDTASSESDDDDDDDKDVKNDTKKKVKQEMAEDDCGEKKQTVIKPEGLKTDYHSIVSDMDPQVAQLIEESHDPKQTFKCKFCTKTSRFVGTLLKHAVSHPGVETFKKPFKCSQCEATFSHRANLKNHRRLHSEHRPFKCDFPSCKLSFKDKYTFASHKQTHSMVERPRPHQCQVCSKRFRKYSHLVTHKRIHSDDKPFMCKFCGFRSTQKGNLALHEQQHTQEKRFQCTFCSKRFHQKLQLQSHELDHTGERPFVCEICGHACKTKYNLEDHLYTHTTEKPHKCDKCDFSSKWKDSLKIHLEITHSPKRQFQCHLCSQLFKKKDTYTRHMRRHSADASWVPRVLVHRKHQRTRRQKPTQELDAKLAQFPTSRPKDTADTSSVITSASERVPHESRMMVAPSPLLHQGYPSVSNILLAGHQQMAHLSQASTQSGIHGQEPVDVVFF